MTKAKKTKQVQTVDHPVERIANDSAKLLETFSAGDVSHQGDIMIVGIESLPRSIRSRKNRQLADGDTQGSRHVLDRGDVFDADPAEVSTLIFEATRKAGHPCVVPTMLIGPVFVSPAVPTANDLTHPEHGNQGFPAGTICAVVFQRNLDAEEREGQISRLNIVAINSTFGKGRHVMRQKLITRIKRQIAAGTYDSDLRLAIAAGRLLAEMIEEDEREPERWDGQE